MCNKPKRGTRISLLSERLRARQRLSASFLRLWFAESISQVGNHVSLIVLPLMAALVLDASPFQVGLLAALGQLPSFLFSFVIGPAVDRRAKRPLLVLADLARASAMGSVWIASFLGMLSMEFLYVVNFIAGSFAVLYGVAYQSYVPVLVERDQLVSANGKLEASTSLAQVTGPGIGGLLVGLFSAPVAILFDVATYLVSSVAIFGIRAPEPDRVPSQESIRSQIAEGIGFIRSNRTLRVLAGSSVINNLFGLMFVSVFVLYLTRDLDMGPSMVGLIFAIGGAGAVVGAASASRISAALGVGRTLVLTQLGMGISGLLVPLALFVPSRAALLIGMVEFIQFVMIVVYAVNAVSLRQAITPQRLQGRVNAAFRFFSFGMQPFGSLIGGICGGLIGLAPTLILAQIGIFSAFILLAGSTLRTATTIPAHDAAMQ